MNHKSVLILGGAGFVGSIIAARFCREGYRVTVVDGLRADTGGSEKNISGILSRIHFIPVAVQDIADLATLIRQHPLMVDAMAWTSHHGAVARPDYDLQLNAESHLHVIRHLKDMPEARVIYLGSRAQYGNPRVPVITEDTPMVPEDVQGIHKLAAESYYRIYAGLYGFNAISLRFPNCFGENQPMRGDDIGLVGSFIRDALAGGTLEVYGAQRRRSVVYAPDVADIVLRVSRVPIAGFAAFNIGGLDVPIADLARRVTLSVGAGRCAVKDIPAEVKAIDAGNATMSDVKLRGVIGAVEYTPLDVALGRTVAYVREVRQ